MYQSPFKEIFFPNAKTATTSVSDKILTNSYYFLSIEKKVLPLQLIMKLPVLHKSLKITPPQQLLPA